MQKKDTGHVYAMKILRKMDMLEKEQVPEISHVCPVRKKIPQKNPDRGSHVWCDVVLLIIMNGMFL